MPTQPKESGGPPVGGTRTEQDDIEADRQAAKNGTLTDSAGEVRLEPGDSLPSPIYRVAPEYPKELSAKKISGKVIVGFYVERDGSVQTVYLVSATNEGFVRSAMACVKKWRFQPGMRKGNVVRVRMVIPIEFEL